MIMIPSAKDQPIFRFKSRFKIFLRKLSLSLRPNSLRFEISAMYTLLMGAVLTILAGALYLILSNTLYSQLDYELTVKAQGVGQVIRSYLDVHGEDAQDLKQAIKQTIAQSSEKKWWQIGFQRRWQDLIKELDLKEEYINFASYSGVSLYRSQNMARDLTREFNKHIPALKTNHIFFVNMEYDNQKIRIINYPFTYKNELEFLIQVGVFPKPITILLQNLVHSILAAIPIIMILTFFIGQVIAGRILKPIRKITRLADRITYEDLSERIESKYYYKEMNYLTNAFNDMISRLERSFRHIEEFGAHVAHELKTPLTIIKGEGELALLKERTPEEYQNVMQISIDECNKMLRIVEDLLLLARMDYQPQIFQFRKVDLIELMQEIYHHTQILAKTKKIRVKMENPVKSLHINADPVHLRRLFLNLIDNALKFTPEKGNLEIAIQNHGKEIHILIKDSGIGMAPEAIEQIFKRFYRVNPQEEGSGLGLNIALTIAKYHQGNILVESIPQKGSTFKVILPKSLKD